MSLKNKLKNLTKNKIKKIIFKALRPFLPFIIIIIGLIFAFCMVADTIFEQESESDIYLMSDEDIDTKVAVALSSVSNYYNDTNINTNNIVIDSSMFTWPIPGYTRITSPFGNRIDPITREIYTTCWYRCVCPYWS